MPNPTPPKTPTAPKQRPPRRHWLEILLERSRDVIRIVAMLLRGLFVAVMIAVVAVFTLVSALCLFVTRGPEAAREWLRVMCDEMLKLASFRFEKNNDDDDVGVDNDDDDGVGADDVDADAA